MATVRASWRGTGLSSARRGGRTHLR
jgi:hypothetical protein